MPTPTRRRRQQQQPQREEIPESIFDALNAHDPSVDPATAREKKAAAGPTVEDLQRQLAEMSKRAEDNERLNAVITSQARVDPVAPKEPTFSMDGLPDPLSDATAYGAELSKRQQAYSKQLHDFYRAQENVTATQNQSFQQLWSDFATSYGEYADDQEGVEFATQKVRKQLERRGVDVNKYMFANSDRFFKDVTKVYDDRFGAPEQDEPAPRNTQRNRQSPDRRAVERDDDSMSDEANRTAGIFGGIDGSGGNRAPKAPPPGDMIKDLQDIQRKTGYY